MTASDFLEAAEIIVGLLGIFATISAPVVIGAALFSNHKKGKVPPDYDNRWPGYPLRPGDYGYNTYTKGRMGNLPAMKLVDGKWINA